MFYVISYGYFTDLKSYLSHFLTKMMGQFPCDYPEHAYLCLNLKIYWVLNFFYSKSIGWIFNVLNIGLSIELITINWNWYVFNENFYNLPGLFLTFQFQYIFCFFNLSFLTRISTDIFKDHCISLRFVTVNAVICQLNT